MKPQSILLEIRDAIDKETDLERAKTMLLEFLLTKKQTSDIKRMAIQIRYQVQSRDRLTKWLYNNILAFQGQSVIGAK